MHRSLPILALAVGCLSPAASVEARFFDLPPLDPTPFEAPTTGASEPLAIQGLFVAAAPGVQRAFGWRLSAVEMAFDETSSWLDDPAKLIRRALEQRLFEIEGLRGSDHDPGLDLWIEAFEGDLSGPPIARVRLQATLGRRTARFEGTAPLAARNSEALAFGLGDALDRAFDALVAWLLTDAQSAETNAATSGAGGD